MGLTPMFGADGWCHYCGVPKHAQTGSLVLQRSELTTQGAWVPNWQHDVVCLDQALAAEVASRFNVELRPVGWPSGASGEAMQMVVPTWGERWFDPEELCAKAIERHGVAGATCSDCGGWRWMPLVFGLLPESRLMPWPGEGLDIVASPEWFGDGWKAFRQVLVRRELAELIAAASPRDFTVVDVVPGGAGDWPR